MKIRMFFLLISIFLISFSSTKVISPIDISTIQGRVYINNKLVPLKPSKMMLDSILELDGNWIKGKRIKGLSSKIKSNDRVKYNDIGIIANKHFEDDGLASISIQFSNESNYEKIKSKSKKIFQGNLTIENITLDSKTTLDDLINTHNSTIKGMFINETAISYTFISSNSKVHMHFNPKSRRLIDATVMLFLNNE